MIKNLSNLLYTIEKKFYDAMISNVYCEIQEFVQGNVTEYFAHAIKKKKTSVASILRVIQELTIDGHTEEKYNNPTSSPSKKSVQIDIKQRRSPGSYSQISFLRVYLDYLFNEKSKGMKGGLLKEKDFKETQIQEVEQFLESSYYYPAMLDFRKTLEKSTDISHLWFREFYLEVTKQIQFPIQMSFPWILAQHCLDSKNPDTLANVFNIFEIYNDAGMSSLNNLKCKYIYDEIVAEVNLGFDQFMFQLSQYIFSSYKKLAALYF